VRVIFHVHRPLKRIDVGKIVFACTREISAEQEIQMAFVTVSHDHPFYILDRREKGVPIKRDSDIMKGVHAPARGTVARIGRATRLLAVNSGKLIKRANTPLPKQLLISLHPDSTFKDVDYLAEQALKLRRCARDFLSKVICITRTGVQGGLWSRGSSQLVPAGSPVPHPLGRRRGALCGPTGSWVGRGAGVPALPAAGGNHTAEL
jgi:hypothetical protein